MKLNELLMVDMTFTPVLLLHAVIFPPMRTDKNKSKCTNNPMMPWTLNYLTFSHSIFLTNS